ncbi:MULTISPECIES: hypothetical protein [Phenylobacterium]|uniref:Uncharacterized protein n=1 Tax=Phenylobacterium koreense TaxID=266125 RepID=A0ABV2ELS0_9CAUL
MWPDVTLILREFARRPTIDRPNLIDPGVEFARAFALARRAPEPRARRAPSDGVAARYR